MPESATSLARECSPFLDDLITRHPQWLEQLEDRGRLENTSAPDPLILDSLVEEQDLDAGLRVFRNQEMLRIVWRELNRSATLTETMSDLSVLAELCLSHAVSHHYLELETRFGTPKNALGARQQLVVIALGKLGGNELNLSSDIDIVFTFPESGQCDGRRSLSNEEFFTRLARKVVRSLSEITEHGFCFRVDTRLRPFGESGPLVCSFGAMEQYYQREGRDWERYALVKARPVAGDIEAGNSLLLTLKPFVYRRYIDFGAVEVLHDMYQSLREDSSRKGRESDVKRGPGGIREIEFLVQTFQLLRGGREPALQTPSLLQALLALKTLGLLPDEALKSLSENYTFLRRLENAIQALRDQQTHSLPDGQDLEKITRIMRFSRSDDLCSALAKTRKSIIKHIDLSFPERSSSADYTLGQEYWSKLKDGLWHPGEALEPPLYRFTASLSRISLSNRAAQRLDQFMPGLLTLLVEGNYSAPVLDDVLNLVLGVCRRSAYLSLLVQNPTALKRMISLFNQSGWVASTVIRHPELLDELIDPSLGKMLPDAQEINTNAERILKSSQDTEAALLALNHMKLAFSLRIAVAELETTLSGRQVQKSLTRLAESIIKGCYQLALKEINRKHGALPGPELAVIAYGSLGAEELSYDSDLDLIFLYQQSSRASDGLRPLGPERYHTAAVRRLLSFLTSTTTSGKLFEVDTRLRPNGRSGLLVSSLAAFEKYQKNDAWTWEIQALVRARPCAGSADIGEAFVRLRSETLQLERDPEHIKSQVRKMRERLREEHSPGDRFKHCDGGLVDIDFVAQLGILSLGHGDPSLTVTSGTLEQLVALHQVGWLSNPEFEELDRALNKLTQARHLSLLTREAVSSDDACTRSKAICHSYLFG